MDLKSVTALPLGLRDAAMLVFNLVWKGMSAMQPRLSSSASVGPPYWGCFLILLGWGETVQVSSQESICGKGMA